MRNIAAFLGLVVGANVGWLFGAFADAYSAEVTATQAGHTYAYVMTLVMASFFSLSVRRVVSDIREGRTATEAKAEPVAAKIELIRERTGRTPPAPFPAFQA
ncbi:MAG: hypothetical protein ABR611_15525 [Chthoniobacterales bacterium]